MDVRTIAMPVRERDDDGFDCAESARARCVAVRVSGEHSNNAGRRACVAGLPALRRPVAMLSSTSKRLHACIGQREGVASVKASCEPRCLPDARWALHAARAQAIFQNCAGRHAFACQPARSLTE